MNEMDFTYANVVIIIGIVILVFNYFVKKLSLFQLVLITLLPTWIIIAVVQGFEKYYPYKTYSFLSIEGIAGLLAYTLPMIILVGGITFFIKYMKFKKSNSSNRNN